MRRLVGRITALVLTGGLMSSPASADSIEVTGGFLDVSRPRVGTPRPDLMALPAAWFAIRAPGRGDLLRFEPACLAGCAGGAALGLGSLWSGARQGNNASAGGDSFAGVGGGVAGGMGPARRSARKVEFASSKKLPSLVKPSRGKSSSRGHGRSDRPSVPETVTVVLPDVTFEPGLGFQPGDGLSSDPGAVAPEPSTLLLIGSGLGALVLRRSRRQAQR